MKKRNICIGAAMFLLCAALATTVHCEEFVLNNTPAWVCFSPGGNCTQGITKYIGEAKKEILVQAYSFTSSPIRKALLNAQKRGINVEIIFDEELQKDLHSRTATFFAKNGVPVYIDNNHRAAHNKVIIIDREMVITGSFNFTYAAEKKNAENILAVKSPTLAETYTENWLAHKKHSRQFKGKGGDEGEKG